MTDPVWEPLSPPDVATVSDKVGDSSLDEIIEASEGENTRLVLRALTRQAEEARGDLVKFFNFVMRHEHTQQVLRAAPHQELMFHFIQHHDRCVLRMPVGTGKTWGMATTTLWLLGRDVTQRGAAISKTETQSAKVVTMVRDYIGDATLNPPLIMVFPWLKPSPRPADSWSGKSLTVERPAGIRDPSLVARGIEGAIEGARLSWLITDDVVDALNSNTKDARQRVNGMFDGRCMSRLDPFGSKTVVCNVPWHREDLTYHLENDSGWPTLIMDIYGYIRVVNFDAGWMHHALEKFIRPSTTRQGGGYRWYRLRAFDPDPEEQTVLWPARIPLQLIEEIRARWLPHEFARSFLCEPLSDDTARCQKSWVEECKLRGVGTSLVASYEGGNPTYTGLDLAFGKTQKSDKTVFFTIEVLPNGDRRILDIESGRFSGPDVLEKLKSKYRAYRSSIFVEGNAAQDYITQFAREENRDLPIRSYTTTEANKWHRDFGVESLFTEIKRGRWIIPCDEAGTCHPEIRRWIDDVLYYQPPPHHTGDRLMASWLAREAARRTYRDDPAPTVGQVRERMRDVGGF